MKQRHLYILAGILFLAGMGVFLYKYLALGFPLVPQEKSAVYNVEARVSFAAKGEPVSLSLFIPPTSGRFILLDESFVSRGFGLQMLSEGDNRKAVWQIRRASGRQTLFYRAVVLPAPGQARQAKHKRPPIEPHGYRGAELEAASELLEHARAKSADLRGLVGRLLARLSSPGEDSSIKLLVGRSPSPVRRAQAATRVLALGDMPARLVRGFRLEQEAKRSQPVIMLEVFDTFDWRRFDLESGQERTAGDFFPWWRGPGPMVSLQGGSRLEHQVAISPNLEASLGTAVAGGQGERSKVLWFSLFSLPVASQQVYALMLLLPVGAFLLILLRNVVGIVTFGTFMPVLIALSFRETGLGSGVLLFCLVVVLGLAVRLYMERLKLLVVPRLAAVLIVVILVMASLSIMMHQMGAQVGLSVALFPMVILTMTIERMSIVWEERGPAEAAKQGVGSLACAALAFLVMSNPVVGHMVFVFPELILVLLAATLLMGRYAGYRLVELVRFKALAQRKS